MNSEFNLVDSVIFPYDIIYFEPECYILQKVPITWQNGYRKVYSMLQFFYVHFS